MEIIEQNYSNCFYNYNLAYYVVKWCIWHGTVSIIRLGIGFFYILNILVTRNRKSVNLKIRVPIPGNYLFVLHYSFYFYGNICQGLAASVVRSSLYKYHCRNYDSVCTKVNLKSDFHIAGQLMEAYPEYSIYDMIVYLLVMNADGKEQIKSLLIHLKGK